MKRIVNQFVLILLSGALLFSLPGCGLQSSQVSEDDLKSGIVYYDATFVIEPAEGVFRSQQRVTLAVDWACANQA